jgi:hypothetical protein
VLLGTVLPDVCGIQLCRELRGDARIGNVPVVILTYGGWPQVVRPASTPGSARTTGTDYVLPNDVVNAWGVPAS